ncbi:MAG: hypothetical protein KJ620_10245 [Candidatus Edwardsbacteria bacterium]|nr:hypothetical protein [Candidatus Edwardsbacteria bacterium]MBU1577443.1 hypothetical protein [Candidatus Edwardsbacteria bacterium]MBU2463223.1 hypothetical protein [Candidatus Edwardsbacteria bacterium]MBU2593010.1 hypothetical protein [Candidatus Edwardsbacteria bacterium]
MEGIFALPYSEYEAILQTQKFFKKNDGFAVLVPTSRQQKGIDFIILNTLNSKVLRVQVKSSRSYVHPSPPNKSKDEHHIYNFWFNNFLNRYEPNTADVYLLFGLYPIYNNKSNIKSKKKFWKSIILALTDSEMKKLLDQVKTKKENKPDRFFGISFNDPNKIIGKRGFPDRPDLTAHILDTKIGELLNKLK